LYRQLQDRFVATATATEISRRLKHVWQRAELLRQKQVLPKLPMRQYHNAVLSLHVCSFVREKMCWWLALAKKNMQWWIPSFGDSYHGDTLQYAKQIFSARLPQMTKYCIMRECENIQSWIS
jgi:hypothetical protein